MITISNCNVLDTRHEATHVDIVIEEEIIAEIGATGKRAADGDVIDGEGLWVLPGLIDLHTHIVSGDKQQGFGDERRAFRMDEPVAMAAFRAVQAALKTLEAGVTTVREIVARDFIDVDLKRAVEKNLIEGPDIVPTGPGVAITGGHGGFMDNEVDGYEATVRLVRHMIKRGVEVIKVFADGPELTGDWTSPQPTYEEIQAAFAEAKRHGRICAAHAMGPVAIMNAARAGADTIEHGWFLDEESCSVMIEHGVTLIPTIGNLYHILRDGPALAHPWVEDFGAREEEIYGNLRLAVQSGLRIGMGSDCGGNEMRRHGQNVDELELYVEKGGMSPQAAVEAATTTPAQILKRDTRIGTVERGKIADLILVGSNPCDNIRALTQDVRGVVKRGRVRQFALEPDRMAAAG
jgi:imidazolonepropionase-like amidohydrolase